MRKKLLSITVTLAMVISLLSGMTLTASAAYGGGSGTASDPYVISSADDFKNLATEVNNGNDYSGAYFKMTNNINLNSSKSNRWRPIGRKLRASSDPDDDKAFNGTFDGGGYKVRELYISPPSDYSNGLFGYIGTSGTVKNLIVSSSGGSDGTAYRAKIVGFNEGTITDCHNTGNISDGICYYNNGTITGCHNTGNVASAGICYYNNGTITDCHNTGMGAYGVCHYNYGTIARCYNTGTITGTADVGGVCGSNTGIITDCYNTGAVICELKHAAGVCVNNDANYNTNKQGTITNCYNVGPVTAGDYGTGGVCEVNYGIIKSCYYNKETYTTSDTISGVAGLTTAQFADWNKFVNWDSNVWEMNEGLGRPTLKSNPEQSAAEPNVSGSAGEAYSYSAASAMGLDAGNYTFEHVAGFKPAGLDFDSADFTQDGIIEGTPTKPGTYGMFIRATDKQGGSVLKRVYIDIAPPTIRVKVTADNESGIAIVKCYNYSDVDCTNELTDVTPIVTYVGEGSGPYYIDVKAPKGYLLGAREGDEFVTIKQ